MDQFYSFLHRKSNQSLIHSISHHNIIVPIFKNCIENYEYFELILFFPFKNII